MTSLVDFIWLIIHVENVVFWKEIWIKDEMWLGLKRDLKQDSVIELKIKSSSCLDLDGCLCQPLGWLTQWKTMSSAVFTPRCERPSTQKAVYKGFDLAETVSLQSVASTE